MKENKKDKAELIIKKAIVIIIIILIALLISINQKLNKIELTQLQNNSSSQMMGYVIKTKNNKVIVIDGGTKEDSQNLEEQINANGGKVDYWFITHPHIDHMGAFLEITKNTNIKIGKIYTTYNDLDWYQKYSNERTNEVENIEKFFNIINSENIKEKVEKVYINEKIKIENINIEILGIANPEITNNPTNNSSMIIKMDVNTKKILFLADTGLESGEKLLETQADKLKADIVQMAHHGQSGVNKDVYEKIQPSICMWPTPEWLWNNDSGTGENTGIWKTIETRQWMKDFNVKQNIVEKDGNFTIEVF